MITEELKKMVKLKNQMKKLESAYTPLEKHVWKFLDKSRRESYVDPISHIKAVKMDFRRLSASVDAVKMIIPKAVWDDILHSSRVKYVKLVTNQWKTGIKGR